MPLLIPPIMSESVTMGMNKRFLESENLRSESAPSGGRTHTWRILSPLPLPLGYRGELASCVLTKRERESTRCNSSR